MDRSVGPPLQRLAIAAVLFSACLGSEGLAVSAPADSSVAPRPARERLRMDANWRFALGHATDEQRDFGFGGLWSGGLAKQNFQSGPLMTENSHDSAFRVINLPHDWAMELPYDEKAEGAWGCRPVGHDFPASSIGWYRKTFFVPESDRGRRLSLEFDGVNHDCSVTVNGIHIGSHFSGFTPFSFDITDMIRCGANNLVTVRVDASQHEGWWYQGAGIYRHVWLEKTPALHVPQWGVQVIADAAGEAGRVEAVTELRNDSDAAADVVVQSIILDQDGKQAAEASAPPQKLAPWEQGRASSLLEVASPRLWSIESPHLYRLITSLKSGGVEIDRCETSFGIRTVAFDADRGFLLNGKPVKIKGMCDHQQQAGLGAAVPDSLWEWRIKRMKAMGANAIRMAHNPPAPEYLDACDRLGMIVMDEQRLFSSGAEGLAQVDSLVRRDRNHPSVIIWSAGNEEFGIQNSPESERIMLSMGRAFHRLDPTRQVTFASSNGGELNGVNKAADVRGINYIRLFDTPKTRFSPDDYHAARPRQPIIGTEEDAGPRSWDYINSRPWFSGMFVWSGFDYYGETGWPSVIATYGVMDLCGVARENFSYYRKAWAGQEPEADPSSGDPAAAVKLAADRPAINADDEDTVVVNVTLLDAHGRRAQNAANLVVFSLTGPGRILGVASGDPRSHEPDKADRRRAYYGHVQVLVQSSGQPGTITLQGNSEKLKSDSVTIVARPCALRPSIP